MEQKHDPLEIAILTHPCPPNNGANIFHDYDVLLQVAIRRESEMGVMKLPHYILLSSKGAQPKTITEDEFKQVCVDIVNTKSKHTRLDLKENYGTTQ